MGKLITVGISLIIGIITFFIFGVTLITTYIPRNLFPEAPTTIAFLIALAIWCLPFVIIGLLIGK